MRRRWLWIALACAALSVAAWFAVTARSTARPGHPPPGVRWIRFVDEDGAPLARVEYEAVPGGPGTVAATVDDVLECSSDDAARAFDLRGVRGLLHRWLGGVRRVGHVRVVGPWVRPFADATEVVVTLGPPRAIAGTVVGPDGAGVAGVPVAVCVSASASWIVTLPSTTASWSAVTDGDGRFLFDGFGPGTYDVCADVGPRWVVPAIVTARGGDTGLRVALAPARSAQVTVLDAGGAPVAGAQVSATGSFADGIVLSEETDENGVAAVGHVPRGVRVGLRVDPPAARDDVFPTRRPEWDVRDVTVRLRRAVALVGTVRTQDGAPVPDVAVWAEEPRRAVRTDAAGRFRIPRLPPDAQVRVTASLCASGGSATAEFESDARDAVVTLDVGPWFAVTCADAWRERGLFFHVEPDAGVTTSPMVRREIPTLVTHLDASRTYTVRIPPTPDGWWAVARDVRPDGRTVELTLVAGDPVGGRVVLAPGCGLRPRDCAVAASVEGVTARVVRVRDDGTFRFAGFPPGGVRLDVVRDEGVRPILASADVTAGDEDVVLTVEAPEGSAR